MWTAILVLLFLLLFTGIISLGIGKEDDNDAAIVIGFVVSVLVVILFIIYGALGTNGIESVLPLLEHIDKGKTVIKEENGEPTDLYITVDGKEYHIILQESKEE